MKKLFTILFAAVAPFILQAQTSSDITLPIGTDTLFGTLELPADPKKVPVVLIISGSGPTDRNCNNPVMTNNAFKMLADSLRVKGIASVRYDKRGVGQSQQAGGAQSDLRFEHYIDDAAAWVEKLKKDKRFSSVIVFGHSEGSLVGMIAARKAKADAYISVSGAGKSADLLLKQQLSKQAPQLAEICNMIIDSLKAGHTVQDVNPLLAALFHADVQPYLISWFQYDPQEEIASLQIPTLIVQGTTDIQVTTEDAALLAQAQKKAQLKIISGMNHVLKNAPEDLQANILTYNNPDLPVNTELIENTVHFIHSIKK